MDNYNLILALGTLAQLVGALRTIAYDLDRVCHQISDTLHDAGPGEDGSL